MLKTRICITKFFTKTPNSFLKVEPSKLRRDMKWSDESGDEATTPTRKISINTWTYGPCKKQTKAPLAILGISKARRAHAEHTRLENGWAVAVLMVRRKRDTSHSRGKLYAALASTDIIGRMGGTRPKTNLAFSSKKKCIIVNIVQHHAPKTDGQNE